MKKLLYILISIFGILAIVYSIYTSSSDSKYDIIQSIKNSPNSTTIAFISDARPELGIDKLIKDFDQIIPQSPTGRVDAIVMIGDMEPINTGPLSTEVAIKSSGIKNVPIFYVLGNHEFNNKNDILIEREKFSNYSYHPNQGPIGSRNTTYSFDLEDMHIIAINEYWDGDSGNKCEWYIPKGGIDGDDSCFKYGDDDGGFIPEKLSEWIKNDLNNNTKKWIIVTGHEPLYPYKRHVGDSLDEDIENRNQFENILISKNVTAFVAGHTHISHLAKINNISHVNAGVIGNNVGREDKFATITYTYVNETGYFFIVQKYEKPTWKKFGIKGLVKVP